MATNVEVQSPKSPSRIRDKDVSEKEKSVLEKEKSILAKEKSALQNVYVKYSRTKMPSIYFETNRYLLSEFL